MQAAGEIVGARFGRHFDDGKAGKLCGAHCGKLPGVYQRGDALKKAPLKARSGEAPQAECQPPVFKSGGDDGAEFMNKAAAPLVGIEDEPVIT